MKAMQSMMSLAFSLLATSLLVGALPDTRQWSSLAERKEFALDMHDLVNREVKEEFLNEDPFQHTMQLMEALQQGLKSFTVEVSVMDKAAPDMKYEEIVELKEFNITTNYFLHPGVEYHSLDDASTLSAMEEVASQHLVQCGKTRNNIKVGDFIVGTASGAWRASPFSVKTKHRAGLVYIRKATAHSSYQKHGVLAEDGAPQQCVKTTTTEIHPFELFDSFHMVTTTHVPFTYDDFDLSDETTYQQPEPQVEISTESLPVDSPAQTCTSVRDQYFYGYGGTFHDGLNDDYSIIAGWTVGCASANMKFPCCSAFTWNYNQNTRAATKSLNMAQSGITGLTCSNCYAYTGAYIMAIVDYYSSGHYMAMEVKVSGALGFNVAANMNNPAFSGSTSVTLLPANSNDVFYLPIGYGLSIATNFGGLVGVLSGSGSATGGATFKTGASASAYLGIGYHSLQYSGTGWTLPAGVSYAITYPSATYQGFSVKNININVELVATQEFEIGYIWLGTSYISASFSLALTGTANYAYYSSSAVTPTVTFSVGSASTSAAADGGTALLTPDSSHVLLSPGDSISLTVEYENFNPGERTELFISVHRDDDISETGTSILQVPFTVNGAGKGVVEFDWVVPWNSHLLQTVGKDSRDSVGELASRLSVRASNQMSARFFAKQLLKLAADPLQHGMITAPAPAETIEANTTFVVVWDNTGLITFKRSVAGTSGLGSLEMVPFVNIELLYEDLDASGATALAGHIRLNAAPVLNTRSAPVVFPSSVVESVTDGCRRRFFLVVSSTEVANLMGWSKGYFNLVPAGSFEAPPPPQVEVHARGLHKADRQFHRPAGAGKLPTTQIVRAIPLTAHASATPAISCSTGTSVTYSSTVEGAFTGMTLAGWFWPVDGVDAGFTLLSSQSCVTKPYASPADPVATPASSSSGSLSAAWVAGISVISTLAVLLISAGLYACYTARNVAAKPASVLGVMDVTGRPDEDSVGGAVNPTANPLSAVEV